MPPAAKRDSGVILFDLNTSNKDEAISALIKICTYKWLSATNDIYHLIFTNAKHTRNNKNFNNIYVTNITNIDMDLIKELVEQAVVENGGDWLDALELAIDILKEDFEKPGIITLQMLFITSLDNCSQNIDEDKVVKIIRDLKEYDINLYIIGPNANLTSIDYTITSREDVVEIMSHVKLDTKLKSLLTAQKIVVNTDNSVICNLKMGIHLFFSYKNPHGMQPWKVPLSFGTKLEIPVSTVKLYRSDLPFHLSRTTDNVKYVSTVLAEDETVEVKHSDLVSGVLRHGKFVKVEGNDMFKIEGPRSFAIIGFTSKNNVPEYYMCGDESYLVLPDHEKSRDSCLAVYNLVDVLAEEEKYAIARRVYNANNKPAFFVLVPEPNFTPKCFVMSKLPYADDIKENYRFEVPTTSKATESEDEFTKFFKSMNVWETDSKVKIPLSPSMMLDSHTSKITNVVVEKLVGLSLDNVDIDDIAEDNTNEFLENLKELWPERATPADDENMD